MKIISFLLLFAIGTLWANDGNYTLNEEKKIIDWSHAAAGRGVAMDLSLKDWSKYDTFIVSLYSEKATDGKILIVFDSNPNSPDDKCYYMQEIKIDFTGWKTFTFPLNKMRTMRSPAGFHNISRLTFNCSGWDMKLNPDMKLKIGKVELANQRIIEQKKAKNIKEIKPIIWNVGEAVIAPFWDPELKEADRWQVNNGVLDISWGKSDVEFASPPLTISRDVELDCQNYDTMILSVLIPENSTLKMSAETDAGTKSVTHKTVALAKQAEYELDLDGAKQINNITLELNGEKPSKGTIQFLLLRNKERFELHKNQWETARKNIDFDRYIKPEDSEISFRPSLGLFVTATEFDAIRQEMIANPEVHEMLKNQQQTFHKSQPPLMNLTEYLGIDRRYDRDWEYKQKSFMNNDRMWIGSLLQDRKLMREAAELAIILTFYRSWNGGPMADNRGSSWECRAFWEAMTVNYLASCLDFCGEYFTNAGKELILRQIMEKGIGPINYNAVRWDYIYRCNQLVAFAGQRQLGYLVFEKFGHNRVRKYTDVGLAEINESMGYVLGADGGYSEGPPYYQYTLIMALPAYYTYAKARNLSYTDILPASLKKAPDFAELMYSTDETQYYMPVGDGSHGFYVGTGALLAVMFPESRFAQLYDRFRKQYPQSTQRDMWCTIVGANREYPNIKERNFIKIDSMAAAASTRKLVGGGKSRIFFWGNAENVPHKQQDSGQFILEFDGETYAMDSGAVEYSSPLLKDLFAEGRHNVLVPVKNGKLIENNQIRLKNNQLKMNASGDEKVFNASVNLSSCYTKFVTKWERKIDSSSPDSLTITDDFQLKDCDGVAFLWNTMLPVEVRDNHVYIIGKKGVVSFKIPDTYKVKIEELESSKTGKLQNRIMLTSAQTSGRLKLDVKYNQNN